MSVKGKVLEARIKRTEELYNRKLDKIDIEAIKKDINWDDVEATEKLVREDTLKKVMKIIKPYIKDYSLYGLKEKLEKEGRT